MSFDKLKEIGQKKKKYHTLSIVCIVPTFVTLFIWFVGAILVKIDYTIFEKLGIAKVLCVLAIFIVSFILTAIFTAKELRYANMIDDYIINKVLDLITENGIESTKIKIIDEKDRYKIAFHNQMVDYDTLQRKINDLLKTLNSISNTSVVVDLI